MSQMQRHKRPACGGMTVLLLCCVDSAHAETTGLVAHWDMAAIKDGEIRDVSGNGHHVTVHTRMPPAAPKLVPGLIGKALQLEASKQLWLASSDPDAFNVAAPATLMAWVRPSDSMRRRTGEILCRAFDLNERGRAPWHGACAAVGGCSSSDTRNPTARSPDGEALRERCQWARGHMWPLRWTARPFGSSSAACRSSLLRTKAT